MSAVCIPYHLTTIEPGAKERIEERLKKVPEINENRPCKKCVYHSPASLISCRSNVSCNFNHDKFKPYNKNTKTE